MTLSLSCLVTLKREGVHTHPVSTNKGFVHECCKRKFPLKLRVTKLCGNVGRYQKATNGKLQRINRKKRKEKGGGFKMNLSFSVLSHRGGSKLSQKPLFWPRCQ